MFLTRKRLSDCVVCLTKKIEKTGAPYSYYVVVKVWGKRPKSSFKKLPLNLSKLGVMLTLLQVQAPDVNKT